MVERSGLYVKQSNEIGLLGKESVVVSSVGVLVHTGSLSPKGNPSFFVY